MMAREPSDAFPAFPRTERERERERDMSDVSEVSDVSNSDTRTEALRESLWPNEPNDFDRW